MRFVNLATAVALAMGLATVAVAQDRAPAERTQPQQQMQSPSNGSGALQDRSGPSGAAGTGSDIRSGAGAQSGPMTEDSVKAMLQAQGYTDVKDVDKKGNQFTADAKKNGKSVKLNVDAQSGKISERK